MPQGQGIDLAILHTLTAGYALGWVHLGNIIGTDHIRHVVTSSVSQHKTAAPAAVADCIYVFRPGYIGNLMDQAFPLRLFNDGDRFLLGNLAAPSRTDVVRSDRSKHQAHIFHRMPAAHTMLPVAQTALAICHGKDFMFIYNTHDLLIRGSSTLPVNGCLHGNHPHKSVPYGYVGS